MMAGGRADADMSKEHLRSCASARVCFVPFVIWDYTSGEHVTCRRVCMLVLALEGVGGMEDGIMFRV